MPMNGVANPNDPLRAKFDGMGGWCGIIDPQAKLSRHASFNQPSKSPTTSAGAKYRPHESRLNEHKPLELYNRHHHACTLSFEYLQYDPAISKLSS